MKIFQPLFFNNKTGNLH